MEDQYLNITEEQKEKIGKLGFRTFSKTSKSPSGQEKIIGNMINLSDFLSYLEKEIESVEKIKNKIEQLKEIDKRIEKINKKLKNIENKIENESSFNPKTPKIGD